MLQLHSSSELFRSDAIAVEPFIFPDPPTITVTVVGVEERRQLEKVTGDLINKRYKYVPRYDIITYSDTHTLL